MTILLTTKRLDLVAANIALMQADLQIPSRLGELLNATVPASWPPGEYDRPAQEFFLSILEKEGQSQVGWLGWYAIARAEWGGIPTLLGSCGYFGPPTAQGWVELGYSVCSEFCNQGFATEMTEALIRRARTFPQVTRIVARTQADNLASLRVLEKTGFLQAGLGPEPGSLRFEWQGG